MIKVKKIKVKKYCSVCESKGTYQIWLHDDRIIQPSAAAVLCDECMKSFKNLLNEDLIRLVKVAISDCRQKNWEKLKLVLNKLDKMI